ncbi:AAA family ATPase [Calothrix sp. FACHB-1219]|uniref:AAA family ATPase n=1 Tax=unclassified Calothrix TaxID=2619626 RepID=UPI001689CDB2|nr:MULTISPECIES: AAA family ATPase [unclassified Calothrix]MBD2208135.1 AAA family ATPase [Calothrix sp. FACHB-168]MBD2221559.1 AAA family ATPase [Calothrix sp. FACHB-1219]
MNSFPHCPDESDWSINWPALEGEFDWLRSLADCPQDPRYHAEGDVLIHTKLVCEALVALPQWRALPARERSIVFAATLLHDVAKPAATEIADDGAISSKGHVIQGAKMAQQILWDLQVPLAEREAIASLVKYGSLPLWFWDKPNPERAVIKASQIIRCDLLALLAEADVKGRYCDDQAQLIERIEFFREFCQENHCFHQPRPFPSAHSRFIYFQKEDGNPNYEAYDDTRCQVVLMSGLPGAGKDTWISENLPDWQVISLDKLREKMGIEPDDDQGAVANAAKALAKEYLRHGQSFVWNATNISRQLRSMLIRLFANYQANIRIVYLETSWNELLRRNRDRAAKVPESVLYRLKHKLEVPNITEAHTVDWIVH